MILDYVCVSIVLNRCLLRVFVAWRVIDGHFLTATLLWFLLVIGAIFNTYMYAVPATTYNALESPAINDGRIYVHKAFGFTCPFHQMHTHCCPCARRLESNRES